MAIKLLVHGNNFETIEHENILGRESPNQHPIASITGLKDALVELTESSTNNNMAAIVEAVTIALMEYIDNKINNITESSTNNNMAAIVEAVTIALMEYIDNKINGTIA